MSTMGKGEVTPLSPSASGLALTPLHTPSLHQLGPVSCPGLTLHSDILWAPLFSSAQNFSP